MPIDVLGDLYIEGREYCALMQAELSLQHQLRSLLKKLHPSTTGDLWTHVTPPLLVSPLACSDESLGTDVEGLSRSGIPHGCVLASAPSLSQAGDLARAVPQIPRVPAWLRLTPKGWPRGTWNPIPYLLGSRAAQHLYEVCETMALRRQAQRKVLETLTAKLPIWQDWCREVRGIDTYGLARLLCETGNLWRYPTVAKVWKRMGVGLWNGERQRRQAGITEEVAMAIGYSPYRRSIVWNLQTGLLTQNKACEGHNANRCSLHPGPYRQLYLDRKVVEEAKAPELARMVWHKRASRYMGKRFLRDLWVAWRVTMPRPATEHVA